MMLDILVVDDEPDVAVLFRQRFRREIREGVCTIEFALSAEDALHRLNARVPPVDMLILSDINMPGKNGLDLLSDVRAGWPEITVFMISAYGDADIEARAYALGAAGFFNKPVDFALLKQRIEAEAR